MFARLFSKPLEVGAQAPDFSLPDEAGNPVRLSALRGRNVVLVFYPGDDTPVCRRQLCAFRDQWEQARACNAVVLGINPWPAARHMRFRRKHGFPFPLLVDRGQRVAALYHASGLAVKRTVYLVDPAGVIRFARRGRPAPEEVLAACQRSVLPI